MFAGMIICVLCHRPAAPSNQLVVPMPYQHVAFSDQRNLVGNGLEPMPLVGDGCDDVRREANAILNRTPPFILNPQSIADFDWNRDGVTNSQDYFDLTAYYFNWYADFILIGESGQP